MTTDTPEDATPAVIRAELDKVLGSEWQLDDPRFAGLLKAARKLADEFIDAASYYVQDNLTPHLSAEVALWTERAVQALLSGNEQAFRYYLKCENRGYTGREHFYLGSEGEFMAMRRKIAEANADLIRNERIADLEAEVSGLRAEIEKRGVTINRLRERYND